MVIKATSSSLGKISDGQYVMCLLPSKSWQNCNNICKQYFFHFLCAALVRDEKRCIPTIGSNITYEMTSFPPFFFQNQTSLRINISQYGYHYPDYIKLGVSFSVLLIQVIWSCFVDRILENGQLGFLFLALNFTSYLYGVADHRTLIGLFYFCNYWFHFLFLRSSASLIRKTSQWIFMMLFHVSFI